MIFNICSGVIDDKPLRFRGKIYHGYHFNCTACGIELNSDARELKHRSGYTANEMVKRKSLILICRKLQFQLIKYY